MLIENQVTGLEGARTESERTDTGRETMARVTVGCTPVESEAGRASQGPFLQNRVRDIALHIPWYGFKTQARIAQDSGVSPAAISRLIRGESHPTLAIALRVVGALSKRLERPVDVSEVFSLNGTFPTPSACDFTGCRNCLPPEAYDDGENLRPKYRGVESGHWSLPTGLKGGE